MSINDTPDASLTLERSNTEIANKSDDWNMILGEEDENPENLTSKDKEPVTAEQEKEKSTAEKVKLYSTINKVIQKRKHQQLPILIDSKRNKVIPNLSMARNKGNAKEEKDNTTGPAKAPRSEAGNNLTSIIELLKENNLLKTEIGILYKKLEKITACRETSPNVPTYNRFEALDCEDTIHETEETEYQELDFMRQLREKNSQDGNNNSKKKKSEASINNARKKQQDTSSQEQRTTLQKPRRKDKPPPINILYQDPKDTTRLIESNTRGIVNFYIKRINNGKHILQIDNLDNFKQIKDLLVKCNTKFYTYTDNLEKPKTVLLKGLNNSYNENEVLDELRSQSIDGIEFQKVLRFSTYKSKQESKILPILVVQLSPESQINNLKKIKYLFHQAISWDKLMRRDVIQCKRCQRLGHAAANCNLPYRCVKCNNNHIPGECSYPPDTQMDKKKLFCVNCNEFGHPASYRGCPKLVENKKRLTELNLNNNKKGNNNKINPSINRALTQPGISYAQITKRTTPNNRISLNQFSQFSEPNHNNSNLNSKANPMILNDIILDLKNNLNRLEKIVEDNSIKINAVTSLLEKLLNQNVQYN